MLSAVELPQEDLAELLRLSLEHAGEVTSMWIS
jgi:hypothetical protein